MTYGTLYGTLIERVGRAEAERDRLAAALAAIIVAIRKKAGHHADESAALCLLGRARQAYEHDMRREECVDLANAIQRALEEARAARTVRWP